MTARKIRDVEDAVEHLGDAITTGPEPIMTSDLVIAEQVSEYSAPWDRQLDEDEESWDSFQYYRDLGLKRSHELVAAHFETSKITTWKRGGRHNWQDRVAAFDREQDRLYNIARQEAIRDMADRHEATVVEAIDALLIPIKALQMAMEDDEDFVKKLSKSDAKALVALANRTTRTLPSLMQAERLARGMPTEIVAGIIEHQVVHKIERNQIAEILAVLDRSSAFDDRSADSGTDEIIDADVVEVHTVSADSHDI